MRKDQKNVFKINTGTGREFIAILGCGSAVGESLLPYVVYKADSRP